MNKRLILVDESIFTKGMLTLSEVLNESINTFRILKKGIEEKELLDTIKKINDVSIILKNLSEKKFEDVNLGCSKKIVDDFMLKNEEALKELAK